MRAFMGVVAALAVVVALVFVFTRDDDNGPPVDPPAPTQQPGSSETPPPPEAVRRLRVDTWAWDASSIRLTITNTGDVFVSGQARCRVDFGPSGVMAPAMALPGLSPGASVTETYTDLWAAGNVPVAVTDCEIIDP